MRWIKLVFIAILSDGNRIVRASLTMKRAAFFASFLPLQAEMKSHRRQGMTRDDQLSLRGDKGTALCAQF
ncbi:MAG: hypothetical protein J6O50_15615 [Ruminiclostridium sp.]|nr:hypothetical protein [Ruminiclostridium sp.]